MADGMRLITVKMPEVYIEALDRLVEMGRYSSRSEAIRTAVRELLSREYWKRQGEDDGRQLQCAVKNGGGLGVRRVYLSS